MLYYSVTAKVGIKCAFWETWSGIENAVALSVEANQLSCPYSGKVNSC